MAEDKTEKATPKKKEDARKKGQVAKSIDVNGAAILLAGLLALSAAGPKAMEQMKLAMYQVFDLMQRPEVGDEKGIGTLFALIGQHVGLALAPVLGACFVAGLAASAGQVGLKPTPQALKPDFKKLNPASGAKQMFSPQHLAFETAKNVLKTAIVGAIVALALFPRLDELASLVGMPPEQLLPEVQTRVETLSEAPGYVDFVFLAEPEVDQKSWDKAMVPDAAGWLDAVIAAAGEWPWSAAELHERFMALAEELGANRRKFQAPVRVALTGRSVGPPLFESMEVMGRDEVLRRLRSARQRLSPGG